MSGPLKQCCCCHQLGAGQFYSLTALMCSIDKKWACKTDVSVQEQVDYDCLVDRLVAIHLQGVSLDIIEQCVCVNCYSFKRLNLRWRDPQTARQWRAGRRTLPDDGYRWVNLGKAKMKGAKHHRVYYKCKHPCCPARKHVDRNPDDDDEFTVTYTGGDHVHRDWGNGQGIMITGVIGEDNELYQDDQPGPSHGYPGTHKQQQQQPAWRPDMQGAMGVLGQPGMVQGAVSGVHGPTASGNKRSLLPDQLLPFSSLTDNNGRSVCVHGVNGSVQGSAHQALDASRKLQRAQPSHYDSSQSAIGWTAGHGQQGVSGYVTGVTAREQSQTVMISTSGGYVDATGKQLQLVTQQPQALHEEQQSEPSPATATLVLGPIPIGKTKMLRPDNQEQQSLNVVKRR